MDNSKAPTAKDLENKQLLFRVGAACSAMRNELIGHSFSEVETKDAIKACEWLLNDLKLRTKDGKNRLRTRDR